MNDPVVIDLGDGSDAAVAAGFEAAATDLTNAVADVLERSHPGLFGGERLPGGTMATLERARQLTFDIGGNHPQPGGASISITGTGQMAAELFMGDDVTLQVIDAAGELVASYDGACVGIQFKTHEATETTEEWVERKHIVKLGDRNA